MQRYLPFIIIGAVLVVFTAGGVILFRAKTPTPVKIANGAPGAEPVHIRGGAQARVTLEEFGDFQCPPCGILSVTLQKIEHDYGDKIRVIFREYPLTMHAYAFTAACAAEAAGLQDRFWPMYDLLFEHAKYWSKDSPHPGTPVSQEALDHVRSIFTEYATRVGVDVGRFQKDMDGEQVAVRLKADQGRASSIGVDRTPVLFIDGVKIPFASFNVEDLHKIIDAALSGKPPEPETPSPSPTESPPPAQP
jgi:protein-disulfide isomerase